MLKKPITYKSFDGETVTEDFYFHLSKSELTEMELSQKGGMESWLKQIVADEDGAAIVYEFKKILLASVGRKTPDGRRFLKSQEIRNDFAASPAFDTLFMELVTDAQKAAQFMNGVMPEGLANITANVFDTPQPENPGPGAPAENRRDPTEPIEASSEEYKAPTHAKDPAAKPAFEVDSEGRRILTRAEAATMANVELTHLLATGQAVIGER